jgi:ribosomal protein S18 acetylase RimI-like enzyme
MSTIPDDFSKESLTNAISANLYGFFRFFGKSNHVEFSETDHLIRWHTKVSHPWFNGVLVTRANEEIGETVLRDGFTFFETRNVDQFTWWLENKIPISDWDHSLRAQGFSFIDGPPGMAIDLAAHKPQMQLPVDFQIKPVVDPKGLRDWTHALIQGFQFPASWEENIYDLFASLGLELPLRHYLGYLSGKPAATSSLFLSAGVMGIYNVATVPGARKRGIGTALTVKAMMDAKELNYRFSILQSSDEGFGVYQKIGFQKLCNLNHYFWVKNTDH